MFRKTGRSHARNLIITAYDITIIYKVKAVPGAALRAEVSPPPLRGGRLGTIENSNFLWAAFCDGARGIRRADPAFFNARPVRRVIAYLAPTGSFLKQEKLMESVGQTCSQNVQRMQSSRFMTMPGIPCSRRLTFSLKSLLN